MKVSILTLFPEMFAGPFSHSIIKIAQEKQLIEIEYVNIRDFGLSKHKMVDDTPYGGGIGMVMRVDVLHDAIQHTKQKYASSIVEKQTDQKTIKQIVVLMSASGHKFEQTKAQKFSQLDHLIIICGHYEGVDERIKAFIDEEISIGDFVVTGGEIPAMLITDSIARLLPGVLKAGATDNESYSLTEGNEGVLLEYPQYTKPQNFQDMEVPEILLSGNHPKINQWRLQKAKEKTQTARPDLLNKEK